MLRKIRIVLAGISLLLITLLFLDFTGTLHAYLGWLAKIQLVPALLSGAFVVLALLVVLTLMFGRVYCSVICPLGILQDVMAWLGKKAKKNRYTYSPNRWFTRLSFLLVFVLALFVALPGVHFVASLLEPYSAFGRMATNLLAPVWQWGNNVLAYVAERSESYAFYETEVWMRSLWSVGIAVATLLMVALFAWRGGRTYCNTICPVGTLLGCVTMLSKNFMFRPVIDTSKCNGCRLCEKNCKGACIDSKTHTIDYSRCVMCMDCLSKCKRGAIRYVAGKSVTQQPVTPAEHSPESASRRAFLTGAVTLAATTVVSAQKKKVDGGLAVIEDKVAPERKTTILPPGAKDIRHFTKACTACQLCISACPNQVLRPSDSLERFMQPEVSYERGYCRPECTSCSNVCPTGALVALTREEKSSRQIGRAVWIKKNCLPLTEGVRCGNCARHCPTGAIQMIPSVEGDDKSVKIPAINTERCIGCGACENLCPSRPFSAIVVEGLDTQKVM